MTPQTVSAQVNSASTPALNGAYSVTAQSFAYYKNLFEQTKILNAFPNGASTITIADINGVPHSFTLSNFTSFFNAISNSSPSSIINIG